MMDTYDPSFTKVKGLLWDFSDQISDMIMAKYADKLLYSDLNHVYGDMENMFFDQTNELNGYYEGIS